MREFTDTYSDDLIYLNELYYLFKANKIPFQVEENLFIPFLCRTYSISLIGSFEDMLKEWKREHPKVTIYDAYLEAPKGTSNAEKIKSLYLAFMEANYDIEKEIFDDLLAIKYIRNTIAHTEWINEQKDHVKKCGFPDNLMAFSRAHLERMILVNGKITEAIAIVGIASDSKN